MKNYATYEEFAPALKTSKVLTVTTDYSRPETQIPFVNSVVLNRLSSEGKVTVTKTGPNRLEVRTR